LANCDRHDIAPPTDPNGAFCRQDTPPHARGRHRCLPDNAVACDVHDYADPPLPVPSDISKFPEAAAGQEGRKIRRHGVSTRSNAEPEKLQHEVTVFGRSPGPSRSASGCRSTLGFPSKITSTCYRIWSGGYRDGILNVTDFLGRHSQPRRGRRRRKLFEGRRRRRRRR